MDEILKYHRLQGKLQDILKTERITCNCIEITTIVLGTESGSVHVISLTGNSVKSFKAHDRQINDVSVDTNCLTIASCSDNGSVAIHPIDSLDGKDVSIVHFNEPLKAICLEDDSSAKRERSFVVGGSSGQLTYHRAGWFSQQNIVLFNGAGSAVTSIAWKGHLVAWADATHVRLMDIANQAAICYLDCPLGVSVHLTFPCRLFWESEKDLWIGWADRCRHLELVGRKATSSSLAAIDGKELVARTVHDWYTDCVICGLSTFDADNMLILGYFPPDEDVMDGESEALSGPMDKQLNSMLSTANQPELQVVRRDNGDVVSSDVLPMKGSLIMNGPWGYKLLTSHHCRVNTNSRDGMQWKMGDVDNVRGGNRGLAPVGYIISSQDVVVVRVRDVNDRICEALKRGNLKLAADLANSDKLSLRYYQNHEILSLYIDDLLSKGEADLAAAECSRLIGSDMLLWERWTYAFAKRSNLLSIYPYIPTSDPRLPGPVYEVVIETFLMSNTKALYDVVRRWGRVQPHLFDHAALLSRCESFQGQGPGQNQRAVLVQQSQKDSDPWLLEAQAHLYTLSGQYEKALNCYLEITYPTDMSNHLTFTSVNDPRSEIQQMAADSDIQESAFDESAYEHVFDLIEKQGLYEAVRTRIIRLVRLSKNLAGNLLVRNIDKLSVSTVVKQLRSERHLLHWYLDLLFKRIPETYNTQEYADFHISQVSLYAEFAPAFVRPVITASENVDSSSLPVQRAIKPKEPDSDFLVFLKTSNFAPLEIALKECQKRRPPLYMEIIYILAKMGNQKEALSILLQKIGDVQLAVEFVEANDAKLWSDLVDYSLHNQQFLTNLIDFVGTCSINPNDIIAKIPNKMQVPLLRQKLMRIFNHYQFQTFLHEKSDTVLAHDTLSLLRQLNQGQRRAQKVDPTVRCAVCARPLFMPPGALPASLSQEKNDNETVSSGGSGHTNAHASSFLRDAHLMGVWADGQTQLWGNQSLSIGPGGVVVFSNKTALHRSCMDAVKLMTKEAST